MKPVYPRHFYAQAEEWQLELGSPGGFDQAKLKQMGDAHLEGLLAWVMWLGLGHSGVLLAQARQEGPECGCPVGSAQANLKCLDSGHPGSLSP